MIPTTPDHIAPLRIWIPYNPNPKQKLFHSAWATEVVYGGAKGGGKSCALVMDALAYALEFPGAKIYLFRETYDDLEANLIDEWLTKVPEDLYRYNAGKHIAYVYNGSRVFFRYIRNNQDADKYQGRSMDYVGVDELTKHSERAIQTLLSCLRSPKGFPPVFRGTCNPGGKGHTWVKKRYVTGTKYGVEMTRDPESGNTIVFIPAQVYDNEVLMTHDPGYVRRLENLPETLKQAFLYGNWDIFEGQYFPEFKYQIHVCKPFPIPNWWRRFRSMDYGLDCTAVYWWAVNPTGKLYIYRELWQPGLILSKAAKRVIELTPPEEVIGYTVASPDLWKRRQETGVTGEEIMRKAGLHGLRQADDSRVPGWLQMREYLDPYEIEPGIWDTNIAIFDHCTHAISDIPALIHDENNPEDAASEPHEVTHAPESIRYAIMSRPPLKSLTPEEKEARERLRREQIRMRNPHTGY